MIEIISPGERRRFRRQLAIVLAAWLAAALAIGASGVLTRAPLLVLPLLVFGGVLLPIVAYVLHPQLRAFIEDLGLRRLTALHLWRIPAAASFFWYGWQGALPPLFVALAGVGDLLAGLLAAVVVVRRERRSSYALFHAFGMLDFLVAVGTGVTLWMLGVPAMQTIVTLPIVLIPLFGVAVSGASHLMAFHLLARGRGMAASRGRGGAPAFSGRQANA